METAGAIWTLRVDGSSTTSKGGVGIVLSKNTREIVAMSFKLDFRIKHLRGMGDSNLVVCQARGDFTLKEPSSENVKILKIFFFLLVQAPRVESKGELFKFHSQPLKVVLYRISIPFNDNNVVRLILIDLSLFSLILN